MTAAMERYEWEKQTRLLSQLGSSMGEQKLFTWRKTEAVGPVYMLRLLPRGQETMQCKRMKDLISPGLRWE